MKTISIFAYDVSVADDFLKLINPMVKKLFKFETYLYTSYGTNNTIGGVGVDETAVRSIKALKAKYNHVDDISVYGLVATGGGSTPNPTKYDEFTNWLTAHIEELDLDGIALDYEFTNNWNEKKKHYTDFTIKMAERLSRLSRLAGGTVKQLSVDIGSYRYAGISLKEVGGTATKVINMGMYTSSLSEFNKELWAMFRSPIKHANQVPAVSFTHGNISMGTKFKTLQSFGYDRLAIFDPLANVDTYAYDVSKFIDGGSCSIYLWPGIIGSGTGITTCCLLALGFYIFNIPIVVQIYVIGALAAAAAGSICILFYNLKSMLQYTLLIFASTIFLCCVIWLMIIYYFAFCKGRMISEGIECTQLNKDVDQNNMTGTDSGGGTADTSDASGDIELGDGSSGSTATWDGHGSVQPVVESVRINQNVGLLK